MEDDGRQPEWQINRFVDIKISNILIRLPAIEWRKFCRVGTGVAYRNSYGKIIRFRGWQKKKITRRRRPRGGFQNDSLER